MTLTPDEIPTLTVSMVAKRLHKCDKWVRDKLLRCGYLEGHKLGGTYAFSEKQFREMLERTKFQPDESDEG